MRKTLDPFKIIVLVFIIGVMAGMLIGGLCASNEVPEDVFFSVIGITKQICIGLAVLIVDLLCICALLIPVIDKHIDETGEATIGVIEDVTIHPHPNQPDDDEWLKKVRFSCTVSYKSDSKEYKKVFSPTALTSKRELYPVNIDKGNDIQIKYCKKLPSLSIIDIDVLKTELKNEQDKLKILYIIIPVIATALYIISIVK